MNQDLRHLARDPAPEGRDVGFRRLHALGLVGLRRAACIAGPLPATTCKRCEAACPHGCIVLGEDAPQLDPAACSGCGMCAAACPTGALAVDGIRLPATVPTQGLVLSCERSRAATDAPLHRVACLGGITVNDWLRLAIAAGDAPIRLVDDGACAACGNARAHEAPWRAPLKIARRALFEAGMPAEHLPEAVGPDALPNGNGPDAATDELPVESRRRFFAGLSRSFAAAVTRAATGETLSADVPVARRRRGGIATHRGDETRLLLEHIARRFGLPHPRSALLPALTASAGCRAHGACSRACPTGALHLETDSDAGHACLQFDAWLCVDCGACAQICPSHALEHDVRAWRPLANAPVVLATIEQNECVRCGALVAAHDEEALCERCRKTENLARAGFALFTRHY